MGIISNSLEISNLEDQVDKELIRMVKVKDSEERIERLKELLSLLQGYTMSQDGGKDDTKKEEGTEKKCEKEDTEDKEEENKSSNMEEMKKIEESDERYVNEKKVKKDTDTSELDINENEEEKVIKSEEKKDENCEDGKKNEVKIGEDDEYDKKDGKNVVIDEDKNGKIEESFSEIFVNLEKTEEEIKEIKKTVQFELEPEDMEMDKIQN